MTTLGPSGKNHNLVLDTLTRTGIQKSRTRLLPLGIGYFLAACKDSLRRIIIEYDMSKVDILSSLNG